MLSSPPQPFERCKVNKRSHLWSIKFMDVYLSPFDIL
jgi:hypothetical protein